jgi:hypothetical protein
LTNLIKVLEFHKEDIMGIMEQKRKEMKREFLALTSAQRIREVEFLFNEFVKLRAKREGITEGEAYLRYAERTKKSYK